MATKPITHQINEAALKLLLANPEGIRTGDLKKQLEAKFPDFHPKTINGCVWKLPDVYPTQVYKPERGLYKAVPKK
jgi:hypothetical protein